jgi:hypothetical protein
MSRQNDGASAFPQHPEMCDAHPDFQVVSLCDYFAADAMLAAQSGQDPDTLLDAAAGSRDVMSRAADIMEHLGKRDEAERLRRQADVCRAAIARATGQEAR